MNDFKPTRVYAIGDVHGMYDTMMQLIANIDEHATEPYILVFLGDMVDRGPKSCQVVAQIKDMVVCPTERRITFALAGNHEQMMLDAMATKERRMGNAYGFWVKYGGWQTMESYKGRPDYVLEDHLEFMRDLPCMFETAGQIFVHAGLDPRHGNAQLESTMLWIRDWQSADYDFGKHVVYGHSVQGGVPIRYKHSTGIDTGACFGGTLTAAWFDPYVKSGPKGFIHVAAVDKKI